MYAGLHQTTRVHRHGMADQTHARRLLVARLRLRVFGRRRPVLTAQGLGKRRFAATIKMAYNTYYTRNRRLTRASGVFTRAGEVILHLEPNKKASIFIICSVFV